MAIHPRSVTASTLLIFSFAVSSSAQRIVQQPLITQAVDDGRLVTLKGGTHPLARPQFDIGKAAPDLPLQRMLLVLKRSPEQQTALHKLLDDQHDKASPSYHKWLTPDEFGREFGPTDPDVEAVSGWLRSHGFQVDRVSHGRTVIEFTGVAAQVQEALHTEMHKYLVNGKEHWANDRDPQIPAALAPAVAGVWTLHDFRKQPRLHISPNVLKTKYTPGSRPDTTFKTSSGSVVHALSPADFAIIYNLNPLYQSGISGAGKIAVVARSGLFGSDVSDFRNVFGVFGGFVRVINDGPDPGDLGGGEEAEATLDASWSGAVAPQAEVDFVLSSSTTTTDGVDLSELYIVDNNVAPVMTESFGSCEAFASPAEAQGLSMLAEQAAAQGITYMVSSGDSGAAGCDNPNRAPASHGQSVSVLSSPQFTVVVGGTEFNDGSNSSKYWGSQNGSNFVSALSYIPENVWNESCQSCQFPNIFSTGGGKSTIFAKPTWQSGVTGIPNDGSRDVPDVSLSAALHDGYVLCLGGSCIPDSQGFISIFLIGGTSASAPSFAGIMNLVDQQHGPQGQANYVLYRLAAAENANLSQCNASKATGALPLTCVFNDVTGGNNSVPGQVGFSAGTGYDLATGLGSVNAASLVNQWSNVSFRATTTALSPASVTGTHGLPISLGISVTANSPGSGTPTGDVSLQTSLIAAPGFIDAFPPAEPGFVTLNNGSSSASLSDLPGGSYTLSAQYAGDANFAPSPPSSPINVTISPESSSTTLTLLTADQQGKAIPFSGGPFGGFVYLRADVAAQSGHGMPTGMVQFNDNGNIVGAIGLNSEGNTITPNGYFGFTAGKHALTAQYEGDNSFKVSTSSPATSFTITPALTTSSLTPISGVVQGNSVTLTANIASPAFAGAPFNLCNVMPCEGGNPFPSGTVTFFAGSTNLGTANVGFTQLTAKGITASASLLTGTLPLGQNTITAQYSGDSNYQGSSTASMAINVDADFAFAASDSTVSVTRPGSSGTTTLTITGQPGYSSTINFSSASCSGLPVLSKCSFTPSSVGGSGTATVTVSTTAATAAAHGLGWAASGFVFAGVLLLNLPVRRFRRLALLPLVVVAIAVGGSGCGGGSSSGGGGGSPGTPIGNYPITITAATSDGLVSHTAGFTLAVQ